VQSQLAEVAAPTLLIVGGNDWEVLEHDRRAQSLLRWPGAVAAALRERPRRGSWGDALQEPGALNQMVDVAIAWFIRHLRVLSHLTGP